ncbi:hypothetical protein MACH17_18690 [Phaeobacter inhibens]|nr:hypothetical protein MACH17_18690 [Phaeobacter inhibens]
MLRLPDGMRDRIKAAAAENGRSMNSEIVGTLLEAYPPVNEYVDKVTLATVTAMRIVEEDGMDPNSGEFAEVIGHVVAKFLADDAPPSAKFRTRDEYDE